MSTVAEIKAAIPNLSLEERAEIARCLHVWEDDDWDLQMKRDFADGKLAKVLANVDADIDCGKLSNQPRFLGMLQLFTCRRAARSPRKSSSLAK